MAPILTIKDLSFHYGDNSSPVFEKLNLEIDKGEFVAVVGGSGVGKSTLLKCVADLAHSSGGTITLDIPERRSTRRRATVFQDGRLLPWKRLRHNIGYGLKGLELTAEERESRIDEVLVLTRLQELADRWPHQLSGGQVQRAGIARALAVHPDLLLMDEPFSAVDAITRQHLQDELLNIWQKTGAAVMFITHDIEEAVYLADRVVVLSGSPAHVTHDQRIDLPRPRGRNEENLQQLAHDIAQEL
ncbi:ABC transporter ATP-binding protein [Marinobacterium sediminicola]|uniref:NitT/TauT family transport system ATP-binding protein n=1 Tax=Marinobacterium sediminicola TaxID=518898 RepID=A0ABY1RXM6_9GAMM|nr:ABC transporter ATP-binding protein [Marinobacterium sediminicola]ULG67746.1 ABC transporter ATP-binding protein [Marinobacterium sediminicola]SMR71608.1 NitT/TauT family transport system ATP-binding protein [Marinobacterium sediminicola]